MKVRVLGCSGSGMSIDGVVHHTTAYLVDETLLIDAGTGTLTLSSADICALTDIFITHSHLDHLLTLPLLIDARLVCTGDASRQPIKIYGLPHTIEAIKNHLFNGVIFPDFSSLPNERQPVVVFESIEAGEEIMLKNHRLIPYEVEHVVPTVGCVVEALSDRESIFFSADTADSPAFQMAIDHHPNLTHLVVEMTFPDEYEQLAEKSKHFCPKQFVDTMTTLNIPLDQPYPKIWTTHAKPWLEERLLEELEDYRQKNIQFQAFQPEMLRQGMTISLN